MKKKGGRKFHQRGRGRTSTPPPTTKKKRETKKKTFFLSVPFALFVKKVLHVPVGDHDGLLEVVEHRCEGESVSLFWRETGMRRSVASRKTLPIHSLFPSFGSAPSLLLRSTHRGSGAPYGGGGPRRQRGRCKEAGRRSRAASSSTRREQRWRGTSTTTETKTEAECRRQRAQPARRRRRSPSSRGRFCVGGETPRGPRRGGASFWARKRKVSGEGNGGPLLEKNREETALWVELGSQP